MNNISQRYARQIMMGDIGEKGQQLLQQSRVLVVGAGGLGSPLLLYLTAAGIGHIAIVDFDVVEASNLNRQILHGTGDVGRLKVESAVDTLRALNPDVELLSHCERVTADNLVSLAQGCDLVIDAVDSFGVKFAINDICVKHQLPFLHGGATGLQGQLYLYRPGQACLRCLFPQLPAELESPQGLGILGATAGVIGTRQAFMAIRFLLGNPSEDGVMYAFDGATMRDRSIRIPKVSACPVCGEG